MVEATQDPPIFRALGATERVMWAFRAELWKLYGWQNVHLTTTAWTSPEPSIDQSQIIMTLSAVNESGYHLCWSISVMATGGRYEVSRDLEGSGQAESYRYGSRTLFTLPDVEAGSLAELCEVLVPLAEEFRAALTESLKHVPND